MHTQLMKYVLSLKQMQNTQQKQFAIKQVRAENLLLLSLEVTAKSMKANLQNLSKANLNMSTLKSLDFVQETLA